MKHPLALLLAAILATSIAAFPAINAQLPQQQQQLQLDGGRFSASLFQNIDDAFRVQVPQGWLIQDINNTGSKLLDESTRGYGILAQLCPEGQQLRQALPGGPSGNVGGIYGSCEGAQENIIYILRYPALDTKLQTAFGVSTNDGITTDDILLYHVQKLEEVGYRSMHIVNDTDTAVNLRDPQTNQTIQTVPAKFVEMTYSTASDPNVIREGYFILTATNATAPNVGMTKGYSIFYEGASAGAAVQTTASPVSLSSTQMSPPARQVFDSFELVAAPQIIAQTLAQSGQSVQTRQVDQAGQAEQRVCNPSYPDVCIASPPPNLNCENIAARNFRVLPPDPHGFDGNDNDGIGCESASSAPGGTEGQLPGEGGDVTDCDPSYPDDCIPPPPPDLDCGDEGIPENFRVLSPDPHDFDRDSDGIGCDSGSNTPEDDDEGGDEEDDDDVEEPDDGGDGGDGGNDNGGGDGEGEGNEGGGEGDGGNDNGGGDGGDDDEEDDDNGGGGDGDEGEGNEGEGSEGNNPDQFEDCVVPPGRDPDDVGC